MHKTGAKIVPIAHADDKRQITFQKGLSQYQHVMSIIMYYHSNFEEYTWLQTKITSFPVSKLYKLPHISSNLNFYLHSHSIQTHQTISDSGDGNSTDRLLQELLTKVNSLTDDVNALKAKDGGRTHPQKWWQQWGNQ